MSSFNLWVLLFQFVNDMPIKGLKGPLVCIAKSQSTTTTKAWLKDGIETASLLKAFYSKSLRLVRSLQYRLKLLIKEMELTLLGLCCTLLCVLFLSRNCSLPNLFTAKILLEGWPCLFCQIFFNDFEVQVDLNYKISASNSLALLGILET